MDLVRPEPSLPFLTAQAAQQPRPTLHHLHMVRRPGDYIQKLNGLTRHDTQHGLLLDSPIRQRCAVEGKSGGGTDGGPGPCFRLGSGDVPASGVFAVRPRDTPPVAVFSAFPTNPS